MCYWFTNDGYLLPTEVSVCDIDFSKGIGCASFLRSCTKCLGTGRDLHIPCVICNGTGQRLVERELVHEHYHYLKSDNATFPFHFSPELAEWKNANTELIEVLKATGSSFTDSLYKVITEGRFLTAKQELSANEILARHTEQNSPLHTIKVGDKISVKIKVKEYVVKTSPITNLAYYSFVCVDDTGKHYIVYQNSFDALCPEKDYMLHGVVKKKFFIKSVDHVVIGIFNIKIL